MNNKKVGVTGELDAVLFLKKKGYKILATNVKTKIGEADIIAERKGTIVFVEVKARTSEEYGSPAEAVTPFKQRKYVLLANEYIATHNCEGKNFRFDVIEVLRGEINHIEDAFRA
jgi:putative endonuclease